MKKILIWLLLFNIIVFSEEIDLLKQIDDSKYEENAVNFFLDTIRKKNNLLVIFLLYLFLSILLGEYSAFFIFLMLKSF